ncbi:hypothetical protein [Agarivorans sp. JK6]|uniref:hypothetical protein n=1 Tax=Agarivorans sp. JK6 TaxID=2997426 RepID=UPI003872B191
MNVWFFSVNRVSDRDFARYGLEELVALGFSIKVIDISDLIWGTKDAVLENEIKFSLEYCNSKRCFFSIIDGISEQDAIICGGVLPPLYHLYLSRKTRKFGLQTLGAMPAVKPMYSRESLRDRFSQYAAILNRKGLFQKVLSKLIGFVVYKRYPFKFVQRSGYLSTSNYPGLGHEHDIIECQSYDIYMHLLKKTSKTKELSKTLCRNSSGYILWIDQAIPYHTDTLKCNGDISIFATGYYQRIKSLLLRLSELYGCTIKISLHPRMYDSVIYQRVWEGWDVLSEDTVNGIRGASLCVTHNSTAIHSVAYFKVPLFLIKDVLLTDNGYDAGITDSFKEELGCILIDSSSTSSFPQGVPPIDLARYESYVRKYVYNGDSPYPINAINTSKYISENGGRG